MRPTLFLDQTPILALLDQRETSALAAALNLCGDGQHPVANVSNLHLFAHDYATACVRTALDGDRITATARPLFTTLLQKLTR